MAKYYDPIYGHIELDEISFELASTCPELLRLRYIGLMNFKSIEMLSLTTTTRLEHSIGLSYLTSLFVEKNPSLPIEKNDALVAALYHDVNCGSYGHAMEWAIDRHSSYDHEESTEWLLESDNLLGLSKKPLFLEQNGIHRFGFEERYSLNFKQVNNAINGSESLYFLNGPSIDLDNIDNVYRMSFYLGELEDKETPINLVKSLHYHEGLNNFVLDADKTYLLKDWLDRRSKVYKNFIYSSGYMGFEYLIFKLVKEYSKGLHGSEISGLFNITDEKLIWQFYENEMFSKEIRDIAKKIILNDVPDCYAIIKSKADQSIIKMDSDDNIEELRCEIEKELLLNGNIKNLISKGIDVHVTTDKRKTEREVSLFIRDDEEIKPYMIGDDESYILVAILGNERATIEQKNIIGDLSEKVASSMGYGNFVNTRYDRENDKESQISLF